MATLLAFTLQACGCGTGGGASAQRTEAPVVEPSHEERPEPATGSGDDGDDGPPGEPATELGALPDGLEIAWPRRPRIERDVDVRSAADVGAARRAGTRLRVRADVERIVVGADDVEVVVDDGVRVGELIVERRRSRVRISGGRFGKIELQIPGRHAPPPVTFRPEWRVTDVLIEDIEVDADGSALLLRGQRIAVVNSRVRARLYSVWSGDTDDFHTEDLILAGNRFESAGPESTVRLVSVRRAVVVDNVLENSRKHDFRVHGHSDEVYFARNTLLNTGIMVGSMPEDRVGTVWLVDNVFHHRVPSLLQAPPDRVERLVADRNRVYSDRWDCFVCGMEGDAWEVGVNPCASYRPPE